MKGEKKVLKSKVFAIKTDGTIDWGKEINELKYKLRGFGLTFREINIDEFFRRYNQEILEDYTIFLCSRNYTDSDVWAEKPTAVERYLKFKKLTK